MRWPITLMISTFMFWTKILYILLSLYFSSKRVIVIFFCTLSNTCVGQSSTFSRYHQIASTLRRNFGFIYLNKKIALSFLSHCEPTVTDAHASSRALLRDLIESRCRDSASSVRVTCTGREPLPCWCVPMKIACRWRLRACMTYVPNQVIWQICKCFPLCTSLI